MSGTHFGQADVLVVGSGPVGSAAARVVHDLAPALTVRMVERGTELPGVAGGNLLNVPEESRAALYAKMGEARPANGTHSDPSVELRPGIHVVDRGRGPAESVGMPAAAESTNVGGMGAFWSCACPRPADSEQIPFIAEQEMERAFDEAERLLNVNQEIFTEDAAVVELIKTLGGLLDRPDERRPCQLMPLACARSAEPPYLHWSGADTVLGPLANSSGDRFAVTSGALCRRLLFDGRRVTGAEIVDVRTGDIYQIPARAVIVAADTLRTPQLLWASGVRPDALGRYLNDQARIVDLVRIEREPAATGVLQSRAAGDVMGFTRLTGMLWVPYSEPNRLYHGQITLTDMVADGSSRPRYVDVGLTWYVPKDLQYEDRVWFDDATLDTYGMPAIQIDHQRTSRDNELIEKALEEVDKVATALGGSADPGGPRLQSAGSSLHYQGSVRMGSRDDRESVCDPYGRVWGYENLFVAGNGVIPTSTACNPTLTSVALAARTAKVIAKALGPETG